LSVIIIIYNSVQSSHCLRRSCSLDWWHFAVSVVAPQNGFINSENQNQTTTNTIVNIIIVVIVSRRRRRHRFWAPYEVSMPEKLIFITALTLQ
jgi:hypothetical protein